MAPVSQSKQPNRSSRQLRQLMAQAIEAQRHSDFKAAESHYRQILLYWPDQPDALHYLGLLKFQAGNRAEGTRLMAKSVEAGTPNAGYLYNLGNALLQYPRPQEAHTCFLKALELSPSYAAAWAGLGSACDALHLPFKACEHFRKAYALEPENLDITVCTANALHDTGELAEAIAVCRRGLQIDRDNLELLHVLVTCLTESGKPHLALDEVRAAVARTPGSAVLQNSMATLLAESGDFEGARERCLRSLAADPLRYQVYMLLVSISTATTGDSLIASLKGKLDQTNPEELPLGAMALHYSLARLLQDRHQYDEAFEHFAAANRIKRRQLPYDGNAMAAYVESLGTCLDSGFISKFKPQGLHATTPIFILGMPRSGTSLVEQILAAHRDVAAGGELPYLSQSLQQQIEGVNAGSKGAAIAAITTEQFKAVGERYLGKLSEFFPGARHVTDKLPGNFLIAGLIHTLLPDAKIIHCRRNALDTCVSCYTTLFDQGQEFSYDLAETGQYYRLYEHIMRHWDAVLPPGSMLILQYEDLVTNLDAKVRDLLSFCNLGWDPNCLEFDKHRGSVKTASLYQVRQPAYTSSIDRWKQYEKHLEPLRHALGHDIEQAVKVVT